MASTETTEFQAPVVPRDVEGYVQSFDINNEDPSEIEKARAFFDQYGFVVFSNVYTPEQCKATIDDIWNAIETALGQPVRHDEKLWTNKIWGRTGLVTEGIIGDASLWTRQILLNRQLPNIHAAFARILGTENLLTNHDRYGMFRPTKENPGWRTHTNLHLDMNPWDYINGEKFTTFVSLIEKSSRLDQDNSYQIKTLSRLDYSADDDWIEENNEVGCAAVNELHVQGLVNLADNKEEDGGFWLVPGFHKYLPQWAVENRRLARSYGSRNQFNQFDRSTVPQLYDAACHISVRAGSAILWNQRTMHGSRANASDRPRYAQFYKMFPAEHPGMNAERAQRRREAILDKLSRAQINPEEELTPLGKKTFGFFL